MEKERIEVYNKYIDKYPDLTNHVKKVIKLLCLKKINNDQYSIETINDLDNTFGYLCEINEQFLKYQK